MKTSDSALRSLLHGATEAAFSDLVTLVTKGGTAVRWTTDTYDVVYGGNTYTAGGTGTAPGVQRGRIREAVGLEISTLEVTLDCGTTAQIGGVALQLAALDGVLDDARVTVQRAYMATPGGAVVGVVARFAGVVSDCEVDSYSVRLRVQSDLHKLSEVLPRHLIREKCSWALGDAGCGVNLASFTTTGTVTLGAVGEAPGSQTFAVSGGLGSGHVGGTITFTSGALSGLSRTIERVIVVSTTEYAVLAVPLPSAPAVGVSVSYVLACDKTNQTCLNTFSGGVVTNAPFTRRRGFDFVPPPDLVVR